MVERETSDEKRERNREMNDNEGRMNIERYAKYSDASDLHLCRQWLTILIIIIDLLRCKIKCSPLSVSLVPIPYFAFPILFKRLLLGNCREIDKGLVIGASSPFLFSSLSPLSFSTFSPFSPSVPTYHKHCN